ncbi:MAG: 50S ribosomal protein L24, partial [Chloroflexi bacterium]|nr:50S ribosomal protein L24 [Chloroflexota bacterium]
MASIRIKQGDEVVVISGPERGKRGSVTQVLKKTRQVGVEGVNMRNP